MLIYPAIDLQQGKCVRLTQGDFSQTTVYEQSMQTMLDHYQAQGSQWVHIVDLDGARDPLKNQAHVILNAADYSSLKIQTGGGIRHTKQISELLDNGIERVIIGSKAVSAPEDVCEWLREFGPERIVLAVDCHIASDGVAYIATHGWQEQSDIAVNKLLSDYLPHGLRHILCTDINRDGTMKGPNIALYEDIHRHFPELQLQASGGVGQLQHIKALKNAGCKGCIVGKAIYENQVTVSEIIAACASEGV